TGWNAAYVSAAEFQRLNGVLDRHCEAIGRDPATIERSVNLMFDLGKDEGELRLQWGDMWDRVAGGSLNGTADQAAERLLEFRAAVADLVTVALRAPVDPELLDRYLSEIAPAVRAV